MARAQTKRTKQLKAAKVKRKTTETDVSVTLKLDGEGRSRIDTGLGFLDHMLASLARHGGFDVTVKASGDLHVDDHHLAEDVGLVLGMALSDALALGTRRQIARYGWAIVPMDESLVVCAVDLSGRSHLSYELVLAKHIKQFSTELIREFFEAFVRNARMTLHLRQLAGRNSHHIIEASFKAFAQALAQAVATSRRYVGVPSTKGVL